jgi:hypothetical protein
MESRPTAPAKRPYQSPNLLIYGNLTEMTTVKVSSTHSDNPRGNNHRT